MRPVGNADVDHGGRLEARLPQIVDVPAIALAPPTPPLPLGELRQQLGNGSARRVSSIEAVLDRHEPGLLGFESLHDLEGPAHRPSEAIEPHHDQLVDRREVAQESSKRRLVSRPCSRPEVHVNPRQRPAPLGDVGLELLTLIFGVEPFPLLLGGQHSHIGGGFYLSAGLHVEPA